MKTNSTGTPELTPFCSGVKPLHLMAANVLCLVVASASSKTILVNALLLRIAFKNKKYADNGFLGAFGSLRFPFLLLPALRCPVLNSFSRLISSGLKVPNHAVYSFLYTSRASAARLIYTSFCAAESSL